MIYRTPLSIVYQTPTHGISNPFPYYFEPPTHYISNPIHSKSNPLPVVYRNPCLWYIEPPTYGIANPLPMEYRTPCQEHFDLLPIWNIEPTHGISNA